MLCHVQTSVNNLFEGLRDRDYRGEGLFVLEGALVIEKALAAGIEPCALLSLPKDELYWKSRVPSSCNCSTLPSHEMEAHVGFRFHRGALAIARRPMLPAIEESALITPGPLLCLWQVSDPDNLGALARSAAALGAAAILLGPGCADPFSRKAMRSAMAAVLAVPLYSVGSVEGLKRALGSTRPLVAAALCSEALHPKGYQGPPPCLVLGHEGYGLPDAVLDACDLRIEVPMRNAVDSLNVAAAGAILMWELFT